MSEPANPHTLRVQDYFSIGYVYLLLLGIARDTIFYGFMDVNILTFSGISDVLISPLAYLTRHPGILGFILFIIYFIIALPSLRQKYQEKGWFPKWLKQEKQSASPPQTAGLPPGLIALAMGIAFFFLGTGIGSGNKYADRLEAQSFDYEDILNFTDGEVDTVKLVGVNSGYVFYVLPEHQQVSVSPIGTIMRMERK